MGIKNSISDFVGATAQGELFLHTLPTWVRMQDEGTMPKCMDVDNMQSNTPQNTRKYGLLTAAGIGLLTGSVLTEAAYIMAHAFGGLNLPEFNATTIAIAKNAVFTPIATNVASGLYEIARSYVAKSREHQLSTPTTE